MKSVIRCFLRNALTLAAAITTAPLWIAVRAIGQINIDDSSLLSCSQFLSLFPGRIGVYLRRGFHWMALESCAPDIHIEFGTWFAHRQVRVGRQVYIGGRCTLGMVDIDENVLIGSNVDIPSGRHQHHFSNNDKTISTQGGTYRKTHIGADSWIGNSAVILADVGDHCVVGAGSVVVTPASAWSVVAGNPARLVRDRRALSEQLSAEFT